MINRITKYEKPLCKHLVQGSVIQVTDPDTPFIGCLFIVEDNYDDKVKCYQPVAGGINGYFIFKDFQFAVVGMAELIL